MTKKLTIGAAVRKARDDAGLTLSKAAWATGYAAQTISRVENGHTEPTLTFVSLLAQKLKSPTLLVAYWHGQVASRTAGLKRAKERLKKAQAHAAT